MNQILTENYFKGSARNYNGSASPEPPPPPPRNHDMSNSSFNDSKESNEISEAECDRDHGPRGNYGGKLEVVGIHRKPLNQKYLCSPPPLMLKIFLII